MSVVIDEATAALAVLIEKRPPNLRELRGGQLGQRRLNFCNRAHAGKITVAQPPVNAGGLRNGVKLEMRASRILPLLDFKRAACDVVLECRAPCQWSILTPSTNVMDRGDRREDIFVNDVDRQDFVRTLTEACLKADWQAHAYCLMGLPPRNFGG